MNERSRALSHFRTEHHFDRAFYDHRWLTLVVAELDQNFKCLTPRRELMATGSFELLHSEHEFRFIFAIVHLRGGGVSRSTHNITLSNLLQGALVVLVALEVQAALEVLEDLVDPAIRPMATNPLAWLGQATSLQQPVQTALSSDQASWFPLLLFQSLGVARSFLGPRVAAVDPIGVQTGHLTSQRHHGARDSF